MLCLSLIKSISSKKCALCLVYRVLEKCEYEMWINSDHICSWFFISFLLLFSGKWHKKKIGNSGFTVQEVIGDANEDFGSMPAVFCAMHKAQRTEKGIGQWISLMLLFFNVIIFNVVIFNIIIFNVIF